MLERFIKDTRDLKNLTEREYSDFKSLVNVVTLFVLCFYATRAS